MGAHRSPDDIRRILDSIRQVVRVLRLSASHAEKNLGLSAAQLFVLHKLGDGRQISVNELADRTHTHQSSVSVVVHRLIDKKLVRSQRSKTDGRRVELAITPAGLRKLASAPQAAQDQLIAALKKLSKPKQTQLAQLLEEFVLATGMAQRIPGLFFEE